MSKSRKKPHQGVRIIGGQWRGRRLPVPDIEGLRPSGDRSRETLFNWLQGSIHGARCLDLFAGSGALGLEAASRGADEVTMIEKSSQAVASLINSVKDLGASQVDVIRADVMRWLDEQVAHSADIVFIDPPFHKTLAPAVMEKLANLDIVSPGGLVYLETARQQDSPALDSGLVLINEKLLGEVRMQLYKKIENK